VGFDGTTLPTSLVSVLKRRGLGGVILFGRNVASRSQLRSLTARLQRAAGGDLLVSVDQEGGIVRRLPWAAPRRGQPAQDTEQIARNEAAKGGRDLRAVGINVDLAPVADVGHHDVGQAGQGVPQLGQLAFQPVNALRQVHVVVVRPVGCWLREWGRDAHGRPAASGGAGGPPTGLFVTIPALSAPSK
jgi:hypothetical protein